VKAAHDRLEAENARLHKTLARQERLLGVAEERRRDLGSEAVQSKAANLALTQTISAQEEELDVRPNMCPNELPCPGRITVCHPRRSFQCRAPRRAI
jgi:hypothetical protein